MLNANLPTLFFLGTFVALGAWCTPTSVPPYGRNRACSLDLPIPTMLRFGKYIPALLRHRSARVVCDSVFTPTDLIVLNIIPAGRDEPILTVDEVDLGSAKLGRPERQRGIFGR